jgi:hypothetical protein
MWHAGQVRQAAVWGCIGFFSTCPNFDTSSNTVPLQFGMTPEAAAAALEVPLAHVAGRKGSEIFYAERPTSIPGWFVSYDRQLWLEFRNGHLTGWHNDWRRSGS